MAGRSTIAREQLWTIDDVAGYLRASTRTVNRRVADGSIPVVRLGRLVRFDPRAVTAALEERRR